MWCEVIINFFCLRRLKMKRFSILTIVIILTGVLSLSSVALAQRAPEAASGPPTKYVEPFGVPVAPAMWLANFLLLYFSSPDLAANMPAYRAALPQEVYRCLVDNPEGCPYAYLKPYFDEQALQIGGSRNKTTFWPTSCQCDPKWEALAPREYRQPNQIHQPLGREKADQLARRLGMDQEMILTEEQYECQIGTPPRGPAREIIFLCDQDLTNSKGKAAIPLSSYGLSIDKQGYVRSNCAPNAPCIEFNKLALPLCENCPSALALIAIDCDFVPKLIRLFKETPLLELLIGGVACQKEWGPDGGVHPSCIIETACPGNGGESNNNCAPSIPTQ